MKKLYTPLYLTLFLILPACFFAQEEIVILKTAQGNLEGTLAVPKNQKDLTLVIIIAGSGPTDRNGNQEEMQNNSLKGIADTLLNHNIASFRFDKRGIGQSSDIKTDEYEMRFDTLVNDTRSWINLLYQTKRFKRILIAGHSEGALIGMVAAQNNNRVNGYISIAGAGRSADVIIKEQLQSVPENIRQIVFPMIDQVKNGDTVRNVPPIFYPLLRPSVQPYMHSWFKYDPSLEIKKLMVPILIIQGNTDIQVKQADAEALSKANPKAKLVIIENMNHVLKDCATSDKEAQKPIYSNPTLPLNAEFVKELLEFTTKMK